MLNTDKDWVVAMDSFASLNSGCNLYPKNENQSATCRLRVKPHRKNGQDGIGEEGECSWIGEASQFQVLNFQQVNTHINTCQILKT